jgi:hypothetical protein
VHLVKWYVAGCPGGWASIRYSRLFYQNLDGLYATGSDDDSSNEGSSEDKTLSDAELQKANDLAAICISTAYERTKARLAGSNDNSLISCLYSSNFEGKSGFARKRLLDELLSKYTYEDESLFLRDAVWAIQLPAMRDNTDNFDYVLVYACSSLSKRRDEQFILETIIPATKSYDRRLIPYPYYDRVGRQIQFIVFVGAFAWGDLSGNWRYRRTSESRRTA